MTAVKIYTCILATIPGKRNRQIKITLRLTQDSGHGKLVQLVFVSHMLYMTKFYCSLSFARQYSSVTDLEKSRHIMALALTLYIIDSF